MKISHEQYLKNMLTSAKARLQELNINNRIRIAEYETQRQALQDQIDSVERQLESDAKGLQKQSGSKKTVAWRYSIAAADTNR